MRLATLSFTLLFLAYAADTKLLVAASQKENIPKSAANNPRAWNDLGQSQLQAGKREEAAQSFAKAIKLDSNFAPPHNGLGILLAQSGDPAKAEAGIPYGHSSFPPIVRTLTAILPTCSRCNKIIRKPLSSSHNPFA